MARKPSAIIRQDKSRSRVFDEQAFVDGVFNNEYILVIGSGVILDRTKFPESHGDINRYIISEINKDRRSYRSDFVDYQSFTDVFRGTALDEVDPIYSLLTDGYDYILDEISPELRNLLKTKLFKFVLTTTIDGYLEALMRDIWGDELRVVNIEDSNSLMDFQTALENSRVNKYSQPTLFYVFGKVVEGKLKPRRFVETDSDAIKIIEKWMRMDSGKDLIIPFLKKKHILSLGCKYDDWYFRFFWYILTRGFGEEDRTGNPLTVDNLAMVFDTSESDQKLKEYLSRVGVCIHEDVWEFMKHIHELITSTDADSPFRQMVLAKRRENGIFISYKSSDVLAASELFCKLTHEKGLNVWFDNVKLFGGDDYNKAIREAISKSKVFIPILSPAIMADLEEAGMDIDTYYSQEWREASKTTGLIILPVAIDGYNLRGKQNQIFEQIIHGSPSGIDMSQKPIYSKNPERIGYEKLLDSIYKHLGIEE